MEEQIEFALANTEKMRVMADKLVQIIKTDYRRENIWQNILSSYKSLLHLNH
jgi:hypothetical protein